MRSIQIALALVLLLQGTSVAKSCGSMTQELSRLRQEYHKYATQPGTDEGGITFDGLTAILDKIVALKHDMRKSDCKIPPRPQFPGERR